MRLVTWLVLVNTSRLLMLARSLLRAQHSTAAPGALPKRCSVFIHVHDVCRQVMDAQQVKTCDNTVLCIVLFMILMIAVFWQTRGMKVLRAEFTRGFHEDLEYAHFDILKWCYASQQLTKQPTFAPWGVLLGSVHLLK